MAGELHFSIDFMGDDVLTRNLNRFGDTVQNLEDFFRRELPKFQGFIKEHFESEGRGEWPPLSPAYAKWKAKAYPGQPIMRRTDTLYRSLTNSTTESMHETTRNTFRWGTKVPYARYHQFGRGVPQRRVVQFSDAEKRIIFKDLQIYLVKAAKELK